MNATFGGSLRLFKNMNRLLAKAKIRRIELIFPLVLSFLAACFEGFNLSLLIPLLTGMLSKDAGFVQEIPILNSVYHSFEPWLSEKGIFVFLFFACFFLLVLLIKNTLFIVSSLLFARASFRFSTNLTVELFDRYLRFGKKYYDKHNAGAIYKSLTDNVAKVETNLSHAYDLIKCVSRLLVFAFLMIMLSWKMTLVFSGIYVIYHIILTRFVSNVMVYSNQLNELKRRIHIQISNVLSSIPLIQFYHHEDNERESFKRMSRRSETLSYRVRTIMTVIHPIQELLFATTLVIIFGTFAWFTAEPDPQFVSMLIVYLFIARMTTKRIHQLGRLRVSAASVDAPVRDVLEMFDDQGKDRIRDGSKVISEFKRDIQIKNLDFEYDPGCPVLEDITLTFPQGKFTAIVGPTGSGKTTLVHLLLRFYEIPNNKIFIDGIDINDLKLESLRSQIAWVSQDTYLLHETILSNLIYGLSVGPSDKRIKEVLKEAHLDDFVGTLPEGLETVIGDRGVRLSGGEKQRLSIARAMLKDSQILILDEATSSLDSQTEKYVQDAINQLVSNKTTIAIAHRLSTIRKADQVIVLEQGRVVEAGGIDDLIRKKGKFYTYCKDQALFDFNLNEIDHYAKSIL